MEKLKRGSDHWRARAKTSGALRDEFAELLGPEGAAERSSGAAANDADADPGAGGGGVEPVPAPDSGAAGAGVTVGKDRKRKRRKGIEGDAALPMAAVEAAAEQRAKGERTAMITDEQRTSPGQGAGGSSDLASDPGQAQPRREGRKHAKAAAKDAPAAPGGNGAAFHGAPVGGGCITGVTAQLGALPL